MLPTIPGMAKQGNNIPSERIKSTSGRNNKITDITEDEVPIYVGKIISSVANHILL